MLVFLKKVWILTKPYWTSTDKKQAFALLATLVILGFLLVRMQVLANNNTRLFYDALQNYQPHRALHFAYTYVAYIIIFALCAALTSFFGNTLVNRWRKWLSFYYLNQWADNCAFYRMPVCGNSVDNPDQRLSDDIEQFTASTLSLFNGFYSTLIQLVTFTFVLWHLSGAYHFVIKSFSLAIPGYLVWCALAYALISTLITCWIGRKLNHLNYQQQHFTADFRFGLVRLRENAEQIALQRGEQTEKNALKKTYQPVYDNFTRLIAVGCQLTFFTKSIDFLSLIAGTLFALPKFMIEKMSVGDLMQISSAFAYVVNGFSFFMNAYSEIAVWRAVVDRLTEFSDKIHLTDAYVTKTLSWQGSAQKTLVLTDVNIFLANGQNLISCFNQTIHSGERVLIMGAYGSGKSTLLRTLAGVWPYASGLIKKPQGSCLFLSQKPYFPIGSLKAALCFPAIEGYYSEAVIIAVLLALNLTKYIAKLEQCGHWMDILSLGEQQMLKFAHVLLAKPAWLFLDEATASLDESSETFVYQKLFTTLPNAAIISVGHRSSLIALHERVMDLSRS